MAAVLFVIACLSDSNSTDKLYHPEDAACLKEFSKATGGLWKIERSKSFVQVDGIWRENQPKWQYVLFIGDSIITFRKSGEPHYWATTTKVCSITKSERTTFIETENSFGLKQKATIKVYSELESIEELIELAWKWSDTGPGQHVPFFFKSETKLRKVEPDTEFKLITDLMKDCKFLVKDGSKTQDIVWDYINFQTSLKNERLAPNGGGEQRLKRKLVVESELSVHSESR